MKRCTLVTALLLSGAAVAESSPDPQFRTITLGDDTYTERSDSRFVSWTCGGNVSSENVLVEVGHFSQPFDALGFVLYDGTNRGEATDYKQRGLNHRWDWGVDSDGGYGYSFVLKPDGVGLYYDFTNIKPGRQKNRMISITARGDDRLAPSPRSTCKSMRAFNTRFAPSIHLVPFINMVMAKKALLKKRGRPLQATYA